MDEDKIDRTIEIILQQQAQFYADMQRIQESQERSEKKLWASQERSEKRIDNLQDAALTLLETAKLTSVQISDLSTKVDGLADKIDKLADAQIDTDGRLNAVIYMAEKFFSNGQNGNSK